MLLDIQDSGMKLTWLFEVNMVVERGYLKLTWLLNVVI